MMFAAHSHYAFGEVLIACEPAFRQVPWIQRLDENLRLEGLSLRHAHTQTEAVAFVERRAPRAVVVSSDRQRIDGLSLLRIIRSLNAQLPCWLITDDANRRMLEVALAMHVISVLHHPVNGEELSIALKRVLLAPPSIQEKPVDS